MEEKTTLEQVIALHPEINHIEVRPEDNRRQVKSFVLRGQKLGTRQLEALRDSFDEYAIKWTGTRTDIGSLFPVRRPVVIEIGFGMGESTIRIAKEHPDLNFLGIEVFLFGFSKLLYRIADAGLDNLRIMRFDAKDVLQVMVPDGSVRGFHIFFPDPWPKKRHHNRRLIQPQFASLLASKLEKGGYIYTVTDWEEYAQQMLDVLSATPGLTNRFDGYADRVPWRPETGFERKGLEQNHEIRELWFEKR